MFHLCHIQRLSRHYRRLGPRLLEPDVTLKRAACAAVYDGIGVFRAKCYKRIWSRATITPARCFVALYTADIGVVVHATKQGRVVGNGRVASRFI